MGSHDDEKQENPIVYKTKVVQFLGRSVPIILQNDNGPCPLLAICNVLLLRNNLNLSLDIAEISLQRLLSLVAERLLDSNSNIENKDEEYVRNQQQNIADAIELLPCLATGLDVNVRFRNIHDFEFTRECAVFDLLDIGLVHGWLCDPQDEVASKVIGANSYNTLVEKLVELQASKAEIPTTDSADFIDFAAATTATLGIPSPSREILLKTKSSEELELPAAADLKARKGDAEEAVQLLQALQSSKDETQVPGQNHEDGNLEKGFDSVETLSLKEDDVDTSSNLGKPDSVAVLADNSFAPDSLEGSYSIVSEVSLEDKDLGDSFVQVSAEIEERNHRDGSILPAFADMGRHTVVSEGLQTREEKDGTSRNPDFDVHDLTKECSQLFKGRQTSALQQMPIVYDEVSVCPAKEPEFLEIQTPIAPKYFQVTGEKVTALEEHECLVHGDITVGQDTSVFGTGALDSNDVEDNASSSLESCEPLYEGEIFLAEVGTSNFEIREPLYEGEAILAECSDRADMVEKASTSQISESNMEESVNIAVTEGIIIENFLVSNASQLTYYGLFCLLEGLKERELCVFFRNNHFSTMFKYKGDLYLLATDQGYMNQADLVWEKLEEVHGDSVFVTGNFTPFHADQNSGLWNEQDAVNATAGYLSSHKISDVGAEEPGSKSNYNSDLQLAMALQHQEFEQQQQTRTPSSPPPRSHPRTGTDGTRLITGPKRSHIPTKADAKTKEKCVVM